MEKLLSDSTDFVLNSDFPFHTPQIFTYSTLSTLIFAQISILRHYLHPT